MTVFAAEWPEKYVPEVCVKKDELGECLEWERVANIQGIEHIFKIILNYAARFAGIAVFMMLIAGGFKYLTAGGNPEKTESARKTITFAIAGLALIILSWFILQFIRVFTGVDVTIFKIIPE